ncbi:hypothetical protein [Actinoplanes sp. NPDC051859]|uniref:hypothetical protein n=1 Tax=Actinoplanes sp. NPDC051859 TaxID=3363909 RepID=UPI0037A105D6
MTASFSLCLRGYDKSQVESVLQLADEALASDDAARRTAMREMLQNVRFEIVLRGYYREEVDQAVQDRLQRLA